MTNRFSNSNSMSGNSYASKKRSLLGFDDPDAEAMVKQTQEQIATQNEAKIGQLLEGTGLLKREVEEIDVELGMSRRQLDALQELMTSTQGGLAGVMERLKNVSQTAGSRHIFYLVLFIVGLMFFLFYFMRK